MPSCKKPALDVTSNTSPKQRSATATCIPRSSQNRWSLSVLFFLCWIRLTYVCAELTPQQKWQSLRALAMLSTPEKISAPSRSPTVVCVWDRQNTILDTWMGQSEQNLKSHSNSHSMCKETNCGPVTMLFMYASIMRTSTMQRGSPAWSIACTLGRGPTVTMALNGFCKQIAVSNLGADNI